MRCPKVWLEDFPFFKIEITIHISPTCRINRKAIRKEVGMGR
jgi:hypothetical protein